MEVYQLRVRFVTERSWAPFPSVALFLYMILNKLFTHMPQMPVTKQYNLVLGSVKLLSKKV